MDACMFYKERPLTIATFVSLIGTVSGILISTFFLLITSGFFIYPLASVGALCLILYGVVPRRYVWLTASLNIVLLQIGPMLSLWISRVAESYEFPFNLVSRILWG